MDRVGRGFREQGQKPDSLVYGGSGGDSVEARGTYQCSAVESSPGGI